jgi:hypothetical protein
LQRKKAHYSNTYVTEKTIRANAQKLRLKPLPSAFEERSGIWAVAEKEKERDRLLRQTFFFSFGAVKKKIPTDPLFNGSRVPQFWIVGSAHRGKNSAQLITERTSCLPSNLINKLESAFITATRALIIALYPSAF